MHLNYAAQKCTVTSLKLCEDKNVSQLMLSGQSAIPTSVNNMFVGKERNTMILEQDNVTAFYNFVNDSSLCCLLKE